MDQTDVIGLIAGGLTSSAALPQLIKTWRRRDAKDVSLKMFIVLVIGIALWIIYGIIRSDMPVIITNALALLLNGAMIVLKMRLSK